MVFLLWIEVYGTAKKFACKNKKKRQRRGESTDGIDKLLSISSVSVSQERNQMGGHVSKANDICQCE